MNQEFSIHIENEEIIFADLTNRGKLELIIVCKSAKVYLFDLANEILTNLIQLNFPVKENGFQKRLRVHSFENYVCIANEINGVVINLTDNNFTKELSREDYYSESLPVAFYKSEEKTFIIHSTRWNRLDITCLNNNITLTQRHIVDDKKNYFDYFQGHLLMSPDQKHFISSGWQWGPSDFITCYSVERFITELEKCHSRFDFGRTTGYHWNRPVCWVDNNTIAVGYNKKEDEDNYQQTFKSEIILLDITTGEVKKRIEFEGFTIKEEMYGEVFGRLYYDNEKFIGLNDVTGLLITDIEGNEILKKTDFIKYEYSLTQHLFYKIDDDMQKIYFDTE